MTGALKMVEQVKNLPPWAAILVVILMGGGVGSTGFMGYGAVMKKLEHIQKAQVEITRKLDSMEWRIGRNSSRLDGKTEKDRQQDKELRDAAGTLTRLETLLEMRGMP